MTVTKHSKCPDCGRAAEVVQAVNNKVTYYWIECSYCCNAGEAGLTEEAAWDMWDGKGEKVFSTDYLTMWADGSIIIADDMGFIGQLGRAEVKGLCKALVEYFREDL